MTSKTEESKQSYPELHDIPQVSISEAKTQLELTIDARQSRGCLTFVGEAGLGKTQIVSQVAREKQFKLITIRSAQWGPLGCGIPSREETSNFFKLIVPNIFPKEGEKSVLLFDEINRGQAHAIAMFFNLLEDREMFDYRLPRDCIVAATMNPSTSNYKVTSIENESAIRRRLKFMYVTTSFNDFLKHAKTPIFHMHTNTDVAAEKACHPQVLDFFKSAPDNIYDRKAQLQNKQFTCPATIETVSEDAYILDAAKIDLHGITALIKYGASIGTNMAHQLTAHLKDNATTISAMDILEKYPKVCRKVKHLSKESKHENLADLTRNVLVLFFASKPEVESVAKNILDFWVDLPKELTASMLNQMKTTATEAKALDYMKVLMRDLAQYPEWISLHKAIDARHKKIEEAVRE